MKLVKLTKDIPQITIKGAKDIEITGITSNSKTAAPGYLFVAKKGLKSDGNAFIPEVKRAGAVCVLTDLYDPSLKDITQVITPHVEATEALLAKNFYHHPSSHLFMVGVTGTSGKTTTTYAIKHLLEHTGTLTGLIGTIEYLAGKVRYPSTHTTPDVVANHKLLSEMVKAGCKACVMEVSSHALEQKRVAHIDYDVAVFTNLTHEHLDYHKDMESYFQAKRKLFTSLDEKQSSKAFPKTAIFSADSPFSLRMQEGLKANIFTFGIEKEADLKASNISFSTQGSFCTLQYKEETCAFSFPLAGRFNIYNALAAISVGLVKGLSLEACQKALECFPKAPGRLEKVENKRNLTIYVDYAHKEDALRNVLTTLRECTKSRLITVFGCGGDRDREKRPKMGRCSEELSDIVILTSDNPRSEDPQAIIKEIQNGFENTLSPIVEVDRKKAIARAIDLAESEDIILIAGKGHETKQYFQHEIIDFDDRLVAKEYADNLSSQKP